jgi:hypothetical protein
MFKVSPASLQEFIDTPKYVLEDRVQYGTVQGDTRLTLTTYIMPNSNYVTMVGD